MGVAVVTGVAMVGSVRWLLTGCPWRGGEFYKVLKACLSDVKRVKEREQVTNILVLGLACVFI